jgi:hypothetical protein
MTPRDATPTEAKRSLSAYREPHRIVPVPDPKDPFNCHICLSDSIPVYQIRGGTWRHNSTDIGVLDETAPIPKVGDYR